MSQELQIITRSTEESRLLGNAVGRYINKKMMIALTGDLGSGKTVFVQGLARGLAVPAGYYITSPTYTLINEYPGRLRLFHVDLYRISEPAELEDTGFEEILERDGVIVVEWADRVPGGMLRADLSAGISIMDDTTRCFHFFCRRNATDLLHQLKTGFLKDKE